MKRAMLILAVAIAVDVAATLWRVSQGYQEGNRISAWALSHGGQWLVLLAAAEWIVVSSVTALLRWLERRHGPLASTVWTSAVATIHLREAIWWVLMR